MSFRHSVKASRHQESSPGTDGTEGRTTPGAAGRLPCRQRSRCSMPVNSSRNRRKGAEFELVEEKGHRFPRCDSPCVASFFS
jgi:hypothetical protein